MMAGRSEEGSLVMQECQEKEGLFMMAFHSPVFALEWALTLQLALTK